MEHRWNKRKPVTLRVVLHKRHLPMEICSAYDVSLGGMFICCGPHCRRKFECAEVEFSLPLNDEQVRFRLPVVVMHSEQHGVGVMFKRMEPKAFAALRQFVDAHHQHETAGGSAIAQPTGQMPLDQQRASG